MADSGLMCSFVANKNSYADPDKYEAMKVFMEVYFKTMDWMKENKEKAIDYCVDMNDENGSSMDRRQPQNIWRPIHITHFRRHAAC